MLQRLQQQANQSKNYWESRSLGITIDNVRDMELYNKRLQNSYSKLQNELDASLAKLYSKVSKSEGISTKEAQKLLQQKNPGSNPQALVQYIKDAQNFDGLPSERRKLILQSAFHKVSTIDDTRAQWAKAVYENSYIQEGEQFLKRSYQKANYKSQYDVASTGIGVNFNKLDVTELDTLLSTDWGYGSFSRNVWKNEELLLSALDDILVTGLARGDSYDRMASLIAKRCDVELNKAMRLVRTESARVSNQGLLDSYKGMNIPKLRFIATLDNRTSEICQSMDTQLIDTDKAVVGYNVPPLHPYCRSTVAPSFGILDIDERAARNDDGDTIKVDYKKYEDWLVDKVGKEQAGALTINKLSKHILNASQPKPVKDVPPLVVEEDEVLYDINKENAEELLGIEGNDVLANYVDNWYSEINKILREGSDLDEVNLNRVKIMDETLSKIKTFEKPEVYRQLELDSESLMDFIDKHRNGNIIQYDEYISATGDPNELFISDIYDGVLEGGNLVTLIMEQQRAVDLTKYNSYEVEVIFERGSMWRIQNVQTQPDGETIIYMKQIVI